MTQFFRDPEAFEALERDVIPQLLDSVKPDDELRVWIAGCATGEEAYSLAMLFCEAFDGAQADRCGSRSSRPTSTSARSTTRAPASTARSSSRT